MEDKFVRVAFEKVIDVEQIVTIYYFEFAKDYVFQGEKHNFWELLYVDKGEVEIMADTQGYVLRQGDIVFHKPNEFHSVWANGKIAPNIVIISFVSNSAAMRFFENKILNLSTSSINILGEIIKEAKEAFSNNLNMAYDSLHKKTSSIFGAEQLLKINLEMFLIKLVREDNSIQRKKRISSATKEKMNMDIVDNIVEYLKNNLNKDLSFEDICNKFFIGKTHLKVIFKEKTKVGVMRYFRQLKMQEAKKLIREGNYNFTEISELLGYKTVHRFSMIFKKYNNMTPSEYAVSVKVE